MRQLFVLAVLVVLAFATPLRAQEINIVPAPEDINAVNLTSAVNIRPVSATSFANRLPVRLSIPAAVTPQLDIPLLARLGYGGVGEELIARWGLLTGFMALALRLRRSPSAAFWIANSAAALLFALGHFGALFAMVADPSAALMAAVVVGNFVPAMGFGWLYRRNGIESAMLAHGGAHALFCAVAVTGFVSA